MDEKKRNSGFTKDYLDYCRENGFEGQPQAMLAHDKKRFPSNSSKLMYGSATGFMVWRSNMLNDGQAVELPEVNDVGRVGTIAEKPKAGPVQSSIFDLL